MKYIIAANILFFSAIAALSTAQAASSSGGFGYVPIGNGQCQVLVDASNVQPIFETSKRAAAKIVMIGAKADCPTQYNGYKVNRIATGFVDGFIYNGAQDSGRKVYIYRKMGSAFTFKYGPAVKK